MMRRWFLWSALAVGLLALAACAAEEKATPAPAASPGGAKAAWEQEWDRVVEAAKKEGTVTVVGPEGDEMRKALSKPMKEKYGITVELLGGSGSALASRIKAERDAGQYLWDVNLGGTTTPLERFKPIGAVEPLEPALILPEVKEGKGWLGGNLFWLDKERMVLAMSSYSTEAFAINSGLVKAADFKSYKDLLDPKWKGKIAVARDPRVSGGGQAKFHFFYVHPELGPDFIRALARQDLALLRDDRQAADWLAQGRYPLMLGASKEVVTPMMKAGAPIEWVGPDRMKEGGSTHVGSGAVALFNRAPHPNAAKVFINWVLSKEGQTEFSLASGLASRRLDVPKDHIDAWSLPKESYIPLDGEDRVKERATVVVALIKEVFGE